MYTKQRRVVSSANNDGNIKASLSAANNDKDDESKEFRWSLGRQLTFAKFVILLLVLWLGQVLGILPQLSRNNDNNHDHDRAVRTSMGTQKTCTFLLLLKPMWEKIKKSSISSSNTNGFDTNLVILVWFDFAL